MESQTILEKINDPTSKTTQEPITDINQEEIKQTPPETVIAVGAIKNFQKKLAYIFGDEIPNTPKEIIQHIKDLHLNSDLCDIENQLKQFVDSSKRLSGRSNIIEALSYIRNIEDQESSLSIIYQHLTKPQIQNKYTSDTKENQKIYQIYNQLNYIFLCITKIAKDLRNQNPLNIYKNYTIDIANRIKQTLAKNYKKENDSNKATNKVNKKPNKITESLNSISLEMELSKFKFYFNCSEKSNPEILVSIIELKSLINDIITGKTLIPIDQKIILQDLQVYLSQGKKKHKKKPKSKEELKQLEEQEIQKLTEKEYKIQEKLLKEAEDQSQQKLKKQERKAQQDQKRKADQEQELKTQQEMTNNKCMVINQFLSKVSKQCPKLNMDQQINMLQKGSLSNENTTKKSINTHHRNKNFWRKNNLYI
jgi:hypothetical protein